MKEGWVYKRLGEICDFQNGFAFKSSLFEQSGEPIIRISDIQNGVINDKKVVYFNPDSYKENLSRFKVYPNDILIAMSGATTGKVGINKTKTTFYLNQRVGVFRENSKILDHYFLLYFLIAKSEEGLKLAIGAAQPNLSTEQIKNYSIPVPSLAEQQQIVSFLDSEFEKIDALKANAETQLQAAKDLFQKALKEMLTPKDGWEKKTLDELCDKAKNIKWSESSGTHKYVDLSSVCRDKLSITDSVDVDYRSAPSRAKQIIKSHDILFATTRPTLRRLCVVNQNFDNEICSTGFCILRPNSKVYYRFLFFNLLTDDFYKYIEPLQTGANYPAVTDGIVKQYSLLVPPTIKEQQQIADNLDTLSAKIKQLEKNYNETITLCNDLKQSLLKKIFE